MRRAAQRWAAGHSDGTAAPGLRLLRRLGSAQVTHTEAPTPAARGVGTGVLPFAFKQTSHEFKSQGRELSKA